MVAPPSFSLYPTGKDTLVASLLCPITIAPPWPAQNGPAPEQPTGPLYQVLIVSEKTTNTLTCYGALTSTGKPRGFLNLAEPSW